MWMWLKEREKITGGKGREGGESEKDYMMGVITE